MQCPRCQTELTRVRTEDGLIDICPSCGGCSIGLAVIRRWFAADAINRMWQASINRQGAPGKACPACSVPMLEVVCEAAAEKTRIDVCRTCMLMWFDPGEQMQLPKQPKAPAEPELPFEARQALALAKVREIAEQRDLSGQVDDFSDWLGSPELTNARIVFNGARAILSRLLR